MALLIDIKHPEWLSDEALRDQLLPHAPDADIRVAADPGNLDDIEMLTVSTYFPGEALRYPNLKLIQKTGAGVNNILADDQLPAALEITRLDTSVSGAEMAEYALAFVLQEQRHLRQYHDHQSRAEWQFYAPRKAHETRVGVMGLGRIGALVAERFVLNGFQVSGWSHSPKQIEGVECLHGDDGLGSLLANCDYVISVLPSTPDTLYLFNRELFARFNPEAVFINVGRGDLVNEDDLLRALDDGQLAGAILDVMSQEPLPSEHPLWHHPRVQLTPHISGFHLGDAVIDIAENYRRLQSGEPLLHRIDRDRGY